MKAELAANGDVFTLCLTPEAKDNPTILKAFGNMTTQSPWVISCHGFGYMEEGVRFVIEKKTIK